MSNDQYDVMQVCEKGHKITDFLKSVPEKSKDFCDKCGSKTYSACTYCNVPIRGYHHVSGVISFHEVPIPQFCHKCGKPYPWSGKISTKTKDSSANTDMILKNLFERFHEVVKQLRSRHKDRPTLEISDEYDVQDLLHALLKINFDDIRKEEWNPSYAGSSSRSDFFLPDEKIIVEVKKTRSGLDNRKLSQELIDDKEHYQKNDNCRTLYCFVYDPEERISNPRGFEKDIYEKSDLFTCNVIIIPRR